MALTNGNLVQDWIGRVPGAKEQVCALGVLWSPGRRPCRRLPDQYHRPPGPATLPAVLRVPCQHSSPFGLKVRRIPWQILTFTLFWAL